MKFPHATGQWYLKRGDVAAIRFCTFVFAALILGSSTIGRADMFGNVPTKLRTDGMIYDSGDNDWSSFGEEALAPGMHVFASRASDGSIVVGGSDEINLDTSINEIGGFDDGTKTQKFLMTLPDVDGTSVRQSDVHVSSGFNHGGPLTATGSQNAALATDGKNRILVLENTGQTLTPKRFLADGTVDPGFKYPPAGVGVSLVTTIYETPFITALPDGGVLIATDATWTFPVKGPTLLKLKEDGTPDMTFGSGGRLMIPTPTDPATIEVSATTFGNGKIAALLKDGISMSTWIVQLGLDGLPFPGVGNHGITNLPMSFTGSFIGANPRLLIRQDGGLVISGARQIASLQKDGSFTPGFGTNGITPFTTSETITWIGEFPGKGILVTSHSEDGCYLKQLAGDGTLSAVVEAPAQNWAANGMEGAGSACAGLTALPGTQPNELLIIELALFAKVGWQFDVGIEPWVVTFNGKSSPF